MADGLDMLNNLRAVDLKDLAVRSFNEVSEAAADLNATQMSMGLRSDGSEILPSYTDFTIELKEMKGQETNWVTLKDEGDHYRQLYSEMKGDVWEYGSRDQKSEALQKKYGKIYGLTDESKEDLIHGFLGPVVRRNFTDLTGLKFT